ncbi:hypothetical protein PVK06_043916 [Gossypium arboreum]|uniref:Uncharacterized protein n=1 Tax=Gossypium arboreum TaxID=29729 RepID=A0ABR0MPV0_GOSAR|nr:hypothetical protein PVK06_043916 [Gossypium arboreum]
MSITIPIQQVKLSVFWGIEVMLVQNSPFQMHHDGPNLVTSATPSTTKYCSSFDHQPLKLDPSNRGQYSLYERSNKVRYSAFALTVLALPGFGALNTYQASPIYIFRLYPEVKLYTIHIPISALLYELQLKGDIKKFDCLHGDKQMEDESGITIKVTKIDGCHLGHDSQAGEGEEDVHVATRTFEHPCMDQLYENEDERLNIAIKRSLFLSSQSRPSKNPVGKAGPTKQNLCVKCNLSGKVLICGSSDLQSRFTEAAWVLLQDMTIRATSCALSVLVLFPTQSIWKARTGSSWQGSM